MLYAIYGIVEKQDNVTTGNVQTLEIRSAGWSLRALQAACPYVRLADVL